MRRLLFLAPLLLANAPAADIPAPLKAMLDAAIASGNEGEIATIVKYARAAAPECGNEIAAVADRWRSDRRHAQEADLRAAGMLDMWKGRAELGGYLTTGNTENVGVSGTLDITREVLAWRHKLKLQADYQESLGLTTREHYLASYEPNYKFGDQLYVYGAAQYEGDRFLGYYDRYSFSAGVGYGVLKRPGVTLDVELGPGYRHTNFVDGTLEDSVAARGSVDFDWKLNKGLSLSHDASAYVQRVNSTVSSTTALNARLIGPLSARVSYNVQYESTPTEGRKTTDTTSRAALVYNF